jgi:uncharacterized caspase-like protein
VSAFRRLISVFGIAAAGLVGGAGLASAQSRLALVIGQGAYQAGALPTTVNDAGLVAQALTSAGFEVVQGRDLDANQLRQVVREFLDKVEATPDAAVFVYLAGYGVQLEGDNYLIPVDARIARDSDVPLEGFRVGDLMRSLAGTPDETRIVVADMARTYPVGNGDSPLAQGLALIEPPEGFLVAFSSAPNIPVADEQGPYGAYATALVEMMRQPGLGLDDMFSRVRLRVHENTKGLQTPWHAANLKSEFVFFEPTETASAEPPVRTRPIGSVPAEEAYAIAVERDTIPAYQDFLRQHPDHPLATRVVALLAARREAITWRKTLVRNTENAYWTYLKLYPNGPHAADCRRRLVRISAPVAPPPVFEEVIYEDVPPPLPVVERVEVVEVVTIIRDAPPPPPVPVYLMPPPDYDDDVIVTIVSRPPPPPLLPGILPIPGAIPVPVRARPPREFYAPVAPITPRGAVALPVVRPPVLPRPPAGGPGGRRPRPDFSTLVSNGNLPSQPGLVAAPQPLPAVAPPRASNGNTGIVPNRPGPGAPGRRPARLPSVPLSAIQPTQPGAAAPAAPEAPFNRPPGAAIPSVPAAPPAQPPRAAVPAVPTAPAVPAVRPGQVPRPAAPAAPPQGPVGGVPFNRPPSAATLPAPALPAAPQAAPGQIPRPGAAQPPRGGDRGGAVRPGENRPAAAGPKPQPLPRAPAPARTPPAAVQAPKAQPPRNVAPPVAAPAVPFNRRPAAVERPQPRIVPPPQALPRPAPMQARPAPMQVPQPRAMPPQMPQAQPRPAMPRPVMPQQAQPRQAPVPFNRPPAAAPSAQPFNRPPAGAARPGRPVCGIPGAPPCPR